MEETLQEVRTEIEQKIMTLSDRAMQITITNDQELLAADAIKSTCFAMRQTVTEFFAPLKKKAHEAHLALTAAEAAELEKIVPGENHVKAAMAAYQLEQARIREAEEARLLAIALEREEDDRVLRAAEIEKEASRIAQSGDKETASAIMAEAEQIMNTPVYVPPPRMAAPPKIKNSVKLIVDRDRLQTVADGLNKRTILSPPLIPGVRFYQTWNIEVFAAANVPNNWRRAI